MAANRGRSTKTLGDTVTVSLFDVLRLTGVAIGAAAAAAEHAASVGARVAAVPASLLVGLLAAWVMTKATARAARVGSEALLGTAYVLTFLVVSSASALAALGTIRLLRGAT